MIQPRSIDVFTHQGFKAKGELNHYNEDRFVTSGDLFAVIDGATSVVPHDMDGLNTSAYTAEFVRTLFEAMAGEEELTASDVLLETNSAFGEHLKEDWSEVAKEGKLGPSANLVLVKFAEDGTFTFAQVGDCILLIKRRGEWHQLTPDMRFKMDERSYQKALAELPEGFDMTQFKDSPPMLKLNKEKRMLSNVKTGVFTGEPQMKKFIMEGEKGMDGVEAMALMCDGMAWPHDGEKQMYITAAQKMEEMGVKAYWQALKAEYDADPDFKSFLRLKHMDDATAVLVEF